jgi:hypothetical protein
MKKSKEQCPPGYIFNGISCEKIKNTPKNNGSKIAIAGILTASAGVGVKAIADKIKTKKVAKKSAASNTQNKPKTEMKLGGKKKITLKRK